MPGAGLLMVAGQRLQDSRIREVGAEAIEVESGPLRDLLHHGEVVEVLPIAMARAQKRHMKVAESTLSSRRLRRSEGEASLHSLGGRSAPHGPRRALARVDLRE